MTVEKSKTGLLPCPFCHSVDLSMLTFPEKEKKPPMWFLQCDKCGCTGPVGETEARTRALEEQNSMNAPAKQYQLKPLKLKTCKNPSCMVRFTPMKPLQSVCSLLCAIAYVNVSNEKKNRLNALKSRRETKEKLAVLKTRSDWLKETQRWFNKFIRLRDDNNPCISCARWHTGQYHAGHYRSVGSSPHLRFNENNVHKQCAPCNNHLSGNIVKFREGLLFKLGVGAVAELESSNTAIHYTIDDIKAIKGEYKRKCKELEDARRE